MPWLPLAPQERFTDVMVSPPALVRTDGTAAREKTGVMVAVALEPLRLTAATAVMCEDVLAGRECRK